MFFDPITGKLHFLLPGQDGNIGTDGGSSSGGVTLPATNFTAADLRKNKTAVDGEGNLVTGSMPEVTLSRSVNVVSIGKGYSAGGSITINKVNLEKAGNTVSIQEGYTTGGSVEVSVEVPTLPSVNITPEALRSGVTAIDSDGNKVTGTMQDTTFTNKAITVNYSTGAAEFEATSNKGYWSGTTLEYQQTLPVAKATAEGLKVTFTQGVISAGSVSVTLPSVNVAAANMLKGTTALNSAGEVIQGSIDNGSISTPSASYDPTDNVFNVIVKGSKGYYASNIEEEYSVSADINAAEVNETDTSVTVGTGYVFEELTFEKGGSGGDNSGYIKCALVQHYTPAHDAYTAVTSINVTGWGLLYNEDYGEEEDFSKYNGVYAVTPDTANEQELTDRVFKHPTEEMYIFFGQEMEYGEGDCWFFSSSTDYTSAYGALAYKNGKELPNGQATWYKVYSDSPVLTTTHVTTKYAAQEEFLQCVGYEFTDDGWRQQGDIGIPNAGITTPLVNGMYVVAYNSLVGEPVAYNPNIPFYIPRNGLLAYFPMDDEGDVALDIVSGIRLKKVGRGIVTGAERSDASGARYQCWENFSTNGSALTGGNTAFDLPENFTISAWVYYVGQDDWRDCLPIIDFGSQQRDTGFGIRVGGRTKARYSLRIGSEETGEHITNVPNNSWHLITFTWEKKSDGNFTAKGYLDGNKVYEGGWDSYYAPTNSSQISMFGRAGTHETVSISVPCKIDDVILWNRALSASEIMQLNRDLA